MLSSLFFYLLRINVMATAVSIIILLLKFILKKLGASRKLLYYLWIIIALRFIFPNFIETDFSLFNIFNSTNIVKNEITESQNVNKDEISNLDSNSDIIANDILQSEIIFDENNFVPNLNENAENKNYKVKLTDKLMVIWCIGTVSMILYATILYFKLKNKLKFAVKGKGNYYETDMLATPCVLGFISPKIYLTLNLNEEEKRYILTHENIHIKRKDYFIKLIAYLILSLHWVNPVCHILFKVFVNDMEMLCDEEAIKELGLDNKYGYMESLLNLSTKSKKNVLPCPIGFSENNTEKRVKNMIKYKKSGIVISIVAIVVCIVATAICLTNKKDNKKSNLNDAENIEKQLNLIFTNKELWYKNTEEDIFSYAVTDLDQNGRLEIIASICQGTGIYTYTTIYEVNESLDNLQICKNDDVSEYDSQADIIQDNLTIFYDRKNNIYHYVLNDLVKNGAAEYYENKRDFYLNNGKISENYLAYKNTIYINGDPHISCSEKDGNEITQGEYNNYEDNYFENFEKMSANIEWLYNYTDIELINLKNSYDKFSIYKVREIQLNKIEKEVYTNALKNLYENGVMPDGTILEEYNSYNDYDMAENKFAISDVDFDGKDELIIALVQSPMAAMRTIIYDYDASQNKFREQFSEFPAMTFYDNRMIVVEWSHNQGSAGDVLWPYTLYRYVVEGDCYEILGQVDAWDKSFSEKCYIQMNFPTEIDKDGDGVVYYVLQDDYTVYDLKEYEQWRMQYITEETSQIKIDYYDFTQENIDSI